MNQAAVNQVTKNESTALSDMEKLVMQGDLSKLSPSQRLMYYTKVCDACGLNPVTRPLEYIVLNGKLTLYARKDATEQLRKINGISIEGLERELVEDLYIVTAKARARDGRTDESIGAVTIGGLKGDARANAIMKAECVPLDYEILTRDGFKKFSDVQIGEEVASMDIQGGSIVWDALEGKNMYGSQEVTEYGNDKIKFEITKGHSWIAKSGSNFEIKPFEEIRDDEWLLLADHDIFSREKVDFPARYAQIITMILTSGEIIIENGEICGASISRNDKRNFAWIKQILMGLEVQLVEDEDKVMWKISKESAQEIFKTSGVTGVENLPGIASRINYHTKDSMLKALCIVHMDEKKVFRSKSLHVIEAYQILTVSLGTFTDKVTVSEGEDGEKIYSIKYTPSEKVKKGDLVQGGTRITDVWCPTTKMGTWICRSGDGRVFLTGNTKAKRRVTLSISGMGWTDESEIETIPGAQKVSVDVSTGEIIQDKKSTATPDVEVVVQDTITVEQATDLKMILDECDSKYRDWVHKTLREKYGISNFSKMPLDVYGRLKDLAMKNMEQTHARQQSEAAHIEPDYAVAGMR